MEKILGISRKIIPRPIFEFFQPAYHMLLAWAAALWYGFPSRKIKVIGVTGTKGKSTVVYLIAKLFEGAGESVASIGSLGYKIKSQEWPNTAENTMPGRFKLQKFLWNAKRAKVKYVVLEVTSEGIKQFRDFGINFDCAIFTNLEPEHIERHGSFENYYKAKQKLFKKTKNIHLINKGDPYSNLFSGFPAKTKIFYSNEDVRGLRHNFLGFFNEWNIAAAVAAVQIYGISLARIKPVLENMPPPPGRLQEIKADQNFRVFIDYAHTPNSLRNVYETLRKEFAISKSKKLSPELVEGMPRLICVLGAAGGNRDKWKRPEFGKIAAEYCDEIILTNEDPYDETPEKIIEEIFSGIHQVQSSKFKVQKLVDRGEAIKKALEMAREDDIVIITGKGSETSIREAGDRKIPWSDKNVIMELLQQLRGKG
ncbi:MAG: UDP-N-acetylmuramoyl-L-alanyl-D-glutamate--2,6-diaminopimelate ligase [Candidatus Liptonbacteria bacterium]|nr:UDP-N-acetylmuramoyl-L-alanyl-D-glutamate--2,6-diaminopimelate ligase [Candidatus Liptonbacteria bacterium]